MSRASRNLFHTGRTLIARPHFFPLEYRRSSTPTVRAIIKLIDQPTTGGSERVLPYASLYNGIDNSSKLDTGMEDPRRISEANPTAPLLRRRVSEAYWIQRNLASW